MNGHALTVPRSNILYIIIIYVVYTFTFRVGSGSYEFDSGHQGYAAAFVYNSVCEVDEIDRQHLDKESMNDTAYIVYHVLLYKCYADKSSSLYTSMQGRSLFIM